MSKQTISAAIEECAIWQQKNLSGIAVAQKSGILYRADKHVTFLDNKGLDAPCVSKMDIIKNINLKLLIAGKDSRLYDAVTAIQNGLFHTNNKNGLLLITPELFEQVFGQKYKGRQRLISVPQLMMFRAPVMFERLIAGTGYMMRCGASVCCEFGEEKHNFILDTVMDNSECLQKIMFKYQGSSYKAQLYIEPSTISLTLSLSRED